MRDDNRPGIAAVLSLIIPGVGQFYNRAFWRGIFWLIITPGLWIGSGGFLGWICHIISTITAYNYANRLPGSDQERHPDLTKERDKRLAES